MSNLSPLSATQIEEALPTSWLGHACHYYPEIGSTNNLLTELAAAGAPAGTMVITDFQTQGRGRLGRRWEAPPNTSLLFSVLLRPRWDPAQAPWLTMIAGVATVYALRQAADLTVGLKWPNDVMVMVDGSWRKVGGLLLETGVEGGQLTHAIMGIGINVNIPLPQLPQTEIPATSILAATGRTTARIALLGTLLQALENEYDAAVAGRSPQPSWEQLLLTRGRPVTVRMSEDTLHGIATGADEWGRLLVVDEQGIVHAVAAGDVSLREKAA